MCRLKIRNFYISAILISMVTLTGCQAIPLIGALFGNKPAISASAQVGSNQYKAQGTDQSNKITTNNAPIAGNNQTVITDPYQVTIVNKTVSLWEFLAVIGVVGLWLWHLRQPPTIKFFRGIWEWIKSSLKKRIKRGAESSRQQIQS